MKINNVTGVQNATPNVNRSEQPRTEANAQPNDVKEVNVIREVDKNEKGEPAGEKVLDDEMMKKSVEQANKSLKQYNRKIERSVHEITRTVMYQIKDTETNEVIREFPPKKIQDMIAKMWELAGLFVDEKA